MIAIKSCREVTSWRKALLSSTGQSQSFSPTDVASSEGLAAEGLAVGSWTGAKDHMSIGSRIGGGTKLVQRTQHGVSRELPHLLLKEALSDPSNSYQAPALQSLAMAVSSSQGPSFNVWALVGSLNLYTYLSRASTQNLKEISKQSYRILETSWQTPHMCGAIYYCIDLSTLLCM